MKKILPLYIVLLAVWFFLQLPDNVQAQTCSETPTSSNSVTYSVSLPETTTYTVWSRMIAPNNTNNSFWLQVDGGCAVNVGDNSAIAPNALTWINYKDGATNNIITMNLAAGTHTVKLTEREGGVGIDKILFTTNTTCIPTDMGTNCPVPTNTPIPANSPTPTISPLTATIEATPQTNSIVAGTPFTVDVIINGGSKEFNAAQATVTVSPNLTVSSLASPSANACNLTYAGTAPSASDPSFAGALLGGSSTQCTVYRLHVTANAAGTGTITMTNGSVKAFGDNTEILSSVKNGTYTITAEPIPTSLPTPTPIGLSTTTLNPIADTTVQADQPDTNFSTAVKLTSDGSPIKIAYMKYDLSSLAGRTLVSAKLRMKVVDPSTTTHAVKSVSSTTWAEETVTYNNRPAVGSVIQTLTRPLANTWVEVDVTSGVTGRLGQALSLAVDTTGVEGFGFYSSNNSVDKVALVLTTQPDETTPTATPTVAPTSTPVPTSTPFPTSTPLPTATPTPLPTNVPTPTPVALTPPIIGTVQSPTYQTSTLLAGSRASALSKIYINNSSDTMTYATTTSWQKTVTLNSGSNVFQIYGEDSLGNKTAVSNITIVRHKLSDIDGDNIVSLSDMSLFGIDWLKTNNLTNRLSDMNEDGNVNLTDFSILAKQYGR